MGVGVNILENFKGISWDLGEDGVKSGLETDTKGEGRGRSERRKSRSLCDFCIKYT